jgi:predicted ATPase
MHDGLLGLLPFDCRIMDRSFLAWVQLCLGSDEAFHQLSGQALSDARSLSHPYTLAFALHVNCISYQLQGKVETVSRMADEMKAIGEDQGFPYFVATGTIFSGWAQAERGDPETGLEKIGRGLELKRRLGAEIKVPFYQGIEAGILLSNQRPTEALELLSSARSTAETTGELWFLAEIYRLIARALLMTAGGSRTEAQEALDTAVSTARGQNAIYWERRALADLQFLACSERS